MDITFTVNDAATKAAKWLIRSKAPHITEVQERDYLPAYKVYALQWGSNIGRIMMVAAVVFAAMLSFSAAVCFGVLGYFLATTTYKEYDQYTAPIVRGEVLPRLPQPPAAEGEARPNAAAAEGPAAEGEARPAAAAAEPAQGHMRLVDQARHVLGGVVDQARHVLGGVTQAERMNNLFRRMGMNRPTDYKESGINLLGWLVYINPITLPPLPPAPVVVQAAAVIPVREVGVAVDGPNAGERVFVPDVPG